MALNSLDTEEDKKDPKKTANALEKTIEDSVSDFESISSDISTLINKKEENFCVDINETNTELIEVEDNLKASSENIHAAIIDKIKYIRNSFSNFERDVYIITIGGAVLYIIFLLLTGTTSLTTLAPLGFAIIIAILVGYWARSEKTLWSDESLTINKYLAEIFSEVSSIPKLQIRSHKNFEGVDQGLHTATGIVKRLLTATKNYNPALKAVFDQATLDFQLRTFITTMFGTLRFYGIEIDLESEKILSSFQSLANTEDEWVSDLTPSLSKTIKIKSLTLSLLYYTYVDNTARAQTVWQKLRDKDDFSELAKILIKDFQGNNLDVQDDKFVELYIKLLKSQPTFEPHSFNLILRNLYLDLQSLIDVINPTLLHFGFKINDLQRKKFLDFVPSDTNPDKWRDELLEYVSSIVHQDKEIITFLVEENGGDVASAQKTFAKIKSQDRIRKDLLTLLITNKLLKVPEKYSTSAILDIVSNKISNEPLVSIDTINTNVNSYFTNLEDSKQKVLQSLIAYNVKTSNSLMQDFENKYLPKDISPEDMLVFFAKALDIEPEFLTLFYYEFTQDTFSLQKKYVEIIKKNKEEELGKLLLSLNLIETTRDNNGTESEDLGSVLRSFPTFKLITIQSRYQSYRNLLTWTRNLYSFCAENKLLQYDDKVDLQSLLKLLKDESSQSPYRQLSKICFDLVSKTKFESNNKETIDAISLSTMVLFFQSNTDYRLREACIEASSNQVAPKIIYNFIVASGEEGLRGNKITLRDVITNTLTDSSIKYPYLEDVKTTLSEGHVPQQISDIATVRFENKLKMLNELERKNVQVSKTFNEMKNSLHTFFESQLKEDVVLELLRMQVVSAYLITIQSKKPVIGEILEEWMPRVSKEYALKKAEFKDMLMMEKGGGRYTRIGIVPIGQSFEDFSKRFSDVFHVAVERYCEKYSEKPLDFSANLIRIFPIEASFKIISGDTTKGVTIDNPALKIRDLFLNNLTDETNLALVAAGRANDPEKVALKHVVRDLFNGFATIWSVLETGISTMIGARKQLEVEFKTPSFDKDFLAAFESKNITELAEKIYLLSTTSTGKQEAKQIIQNNLSALLKKSGSRMSQNEQEVLSNEIFDKLCSIGMILSLK